MGIRKMRGVRCAPTLAGAVVVLSTTGNGHHAGAAVLNGGFESVSNASPSSTGTFSGWQEAANSAPAAPALNAALTHGGLTPGSTVAARLLGATANGGALIQDNLEGTPGSWQFDVDFATADPGGATERSVDLMLVFAFNTPGAGGAHSIHFRVVDESADGDADLQAFRRDINPDLGTPTFAEWVTLATNLPFSNDANADGALDGATDTLNPVHLRVNGDFANAGGPRYTVAVGNAAPATVAYFQDGVPSAASDNIDRVAFAGNFSAVGYVVDNVELTTIVTPEPGAASVGCLTFAAGLLRRSRRRRP